MSRQRRALAALVLRSLTSCGMARPIRPTRALPIALGLVALALGLRPLAPARADVGAWSTAGPPEPVWAVVVDPTGDQRVLAAGETGVWRSPDGGNTWTQIGSTPVRRSLALDPAGPNTVYAAGDAGRTLLKSADGGATWTPVYAGTAPGSLQIYAVAVDPNTRGAVYAGITAADGLAQVLRSTDGGATWQAALRPDQRGAGGIGPTAVTALAALPGVPGLVFAGLQTYHGGSVLKSTDGGATWASVYTGGLTPLAAPYGLAVAGTSAAGATVYASFSITGIVSLIRSDDGGATWTDITPSLPLGRANAALSLLTNPLQPQWVYLATSSQSRPSDELRAGVFASGDRGQTWTPAGQLDLRVNGDSGLSLAGPSRTLYAATPGGVYQYTIAWPALPLFRDYYDLHDGYRLLGTAISLRIDLGGRATQYFEKGRLEDHTGESPDPNWRFLYGLLVDELHAARAPLPVGGDVSSLDYAGLHALADPAQRIAPPAGYSGSGPMNAAGGDTFVPFTPDLSGAPGHLVPAYFWEYVNRPDLFPGGWLHDVGLPVSEAQPVQVTKLLPDGPVQRAIVVQAFQRTILTYDPANPADWQVERANTGADYRKYFPERAGP